jgi:hypothetical protein
MDRQFPARSKRVPLRRCVRRNRIRVHAARRPAQAPDELDPPRRAKSRSSGFIRYCQLARSSERSGSTAEVEISRAPNESSWPSEGTPDPSMVCASSQIPWGFSEQLAPARQTKPRRVDRRERSPACAPNELDSSGHDDRSHDCQGSSDVAGWRGGFPSRDGCRNETKCNHTICPSMCRHRDLRVSTPARGTKWTKGAKSAPCGRGVAPAPRRPAGDERGGGRCRVVRRDGPSPVRLRRSPRNGSATRHQTNPTRLRTRRPKL